MAGTLSLAINAVNALANTVLENSFPDTGTISRPGNSLGDYGTATPSFSTVASNVGCSWKPAGKDAKEYVRALKISSVSAYELEFTVGTNVRPQDRVTVAARGEEAARTFEVKGVLRVSGVSIKVLCTLEES
jgi:hypothetical protein